MNKRLLAVTVILTLLGFIATGCAGQQAELDQGGEAAVSYSYLIKADNQGAYTLTGKCFGKSKVTIGEPFNKTFVCSDDQFNSIVDMSQIADGSWQTPIADETNSVIQMRRTLKDTIYPSATVLGLPGVVSLSDDSAGAIQVTGTCSEEGLFVSVAYSNHSSSSVCKNGSFQIALNFLGLDPGNLTLTLHHADVAGNDVGFDSTLVLLP